jgi:3'-phosphoadenosine 5'-phosphosulfate sulfotransferase (PAPS reductase)/FAD synthetase
MCLPCQGHGRIGAMKHIASCSFGKDSLATILLALEHGEPLDEAVYCEVMFDKRTSGEVPEHRTFIYETALPRLEQLGVPVRVLRSDKTYLDLFAGAITRGPKKGLRRGFPLCGHCYVQRDCKLRPIRRYNRTLTPDTVQYVGIASDEPVRLRRLQGDQVSLLEKYHYTEEDAKQLCQTAGLLSPVYAFTDRGGCWFCPNAKRKELRHLYDHHPELWAKMLELQAMPGKVSEKFNRTERFSDIDTAFRKEDALCQKSSIKKEKEMRTISNQKYEITDMAHEEYPFLHRIRALRDICGEIRAGDIGGFVESESNLSAEPGDCAWIFDDAIAAGDAYVDRDACLRGDAIACGSAYVSKGSVMSGHSRAEDNAYLRGASMTGKALASGNAQIIHDPHTMGTPILSGNCKVYGTIQGDVRVTGSAVILPCEEVRNDTRDTFVLSGKSRSVIRGIGRETLKPLQKEVSHMKTKTLKKRGVER